MANIFKTIDSVSLIKTLRDFGLALRQFFATKSDINAVESALTDLDNRKIEASDIPSSLPANGGNADYATSAGSVDWDGVKNKPTSFTPSSHTHTTSEITNFPTSLPANGGNADTATALTSNAGDSVNPIYFSGGKPVACTMSTEAPYGIVRSFMYGTYTSANQFFGNGTIVTIDPKGTGCISDNDTILSLGYNPTRNTQLLVPYDRDGVYYRRINDDLNYGSWKKLAFTSDIPTSLPANGGNADYATSAGNASTADSVDWSGVTNKPSSFTPSSHTHTKSEITDFPTSLPANGGNADYATSAGNAKLHNGYTIVQTNGLTSTIRDFTLGTLVRTSIDYSVAAGDSFYVEIKGNTYHSAINSCFTQIQGYIYDNTIIAYGVTHLGVLKITPITAMNIDGKLCFWFPRLGYWMGFDIRCYTGTNYAINTVTSIENSADPGGTKRVTLTENEITSYHSGNLTSSVIGNLGTLSNNISGNAATASNVDWSGVTNRPTNVSQFTNDAGYITASNAKFGNYLPLSGGTMTGTLTLANSSVTDGDDTTELFSVYSGTGYKNGLSIFSIDNKTYINAKPYGYGTANALYLRTYNSGVVDALVLAANGDATFAGNINSTGFVKDGSSDNYVLLGGGGHKAESSLSVNYAASAGSVAWDNVANKPTSLPANGGNADTVDNLHASDFVRAYPTFGTSYSIDSDWGQSIVTFDPVVGGTYPFSTPNSTILNLGNDFIRRKQLFFDYDSDNIYFRRHRNSSWTDWVRIALASDIPTSLPANGGNADYATSAGTANSTSHILYNNNFDTNYGNYAIFQQYTEISDFPHNGWFNSIKMLHDNSQGYFTEIATSFTGEDGMWRRVLNYGEQLGWYKMLDSGNFNSYAPKLDGTGANGTWGINISGNAASASKLETARTLTIGNTGKSFDGSSNVSWTLSEIGAASSSHTHTTSEITNFPTSLPANGGTSNYTKYLRGRQSDGTYYGSEAVNNIIAEWNTKSDNRWYLKAASTYECRVDYATSAGNASTLGGRPVSDFILKSDHAGDMYETNEEGTESCKVMLSWQYNPNSIGTFVGIIQVPVPSVKAMEIGADCIKQTNPLTLLVGDKISYTWEELHWLLRCSNTENIVYTTKYATPDTSFPSMEDENPDSPPTIIEISVSYSKTQDLRYVQVTVENMYGRAYYIQKQ